MGWGWCGGYAPKCNRHFAVGMIGMLYSKLQQYLQQNFTITAVFRKRFQATERPTFIHKLDRSGIWTLPTLFRIQVRGCFKSIKPSLVVRCPLASSLFRYRAPSLRTMRISHHISYSPSTLTVVLLNNSDECLFLAECDLSWGPCRLAWCWTAIFSPGITVMIMDLQMHYFGWGNVVLLIDGCYVPSLWHNKFWFKSYLKYTITLVIGGMEQSQSPGTSFAQRYWLNQWWI